MEETPAKTPQPRRRVAAGKAPSVSPLEATQPADEVADSASPGREDILEHNLVALELDKDTVKRIERLPRDVGWLLITAGLVGVIVPGVLGVPFLVLGGLVVMPLTSRRAERWLGGHTPKMFKGSVRQINRFLDDLDRRYPSRQDV
jgi:hypothetical protein